MENLLIEMSETIERQASVIAKQALLIAELKSIIEAD